MSKYSPKQVRNLNIAVIIALVGGFFFLRSYLAVMMLAAITGFIFYPIHRRLLNRYKRPGLSATMTFLISLIIIIIPLGFVIFVTVLQIQNLIHTVSSNPSIQSGEFAHSLLDSVNNFLSHFPGAHVITWDEVNTAVNKLVTSLANGALDLITTSIGNFTKIITSSIIYIYLFVNILIHHEALLKTIKALNPLGDDMSNMYLQKMGSMTKAMTVGQFVIAGLQGLESATVLYLVGFHNLFFFFFILLSFLSLIPLGAGIVTIPLGIALILTGNVWQGVIVIANHLLVVTNIDNVVRPLLVPKEVALNSALTILSVFAGVAMFGFIGIIIGPVLMILIVSTIQVYVAHSKEIKSES